MKKIPLLLFAIILFSCQNTEGQRKYDSLHVDYKKDNIYKKKSNEIYKTYYLLENDTVLFKQENYLYANNPKEEVKEYSRKYSENAVLQISDSIFMYISYRNEFFLIENSENRYSFLGTINNELDSYQVDGIDAVDIYTTSEIKKIADEKYIIIFTSEGNYKVGVFKITKKGILKEFLSKGCLFYEDWYEWESFYKIRNGKIFLNYLIDPNRDEIGQVELKYENGKYSLDLNQCE
ncbi:MAG: hypothetical protein AAF348_13935 [Bacteroidota bacterium]